MASGDAGGRSAGAPGNVLSLGSLADKDGSDKEIAELRQTLQSLSTAAAAATSSSALTATSFGRDVRRKRAVSLQMERRLPYSQPSTEHDYVPEHLVSPFSAQGGRHKLKGPLQRIVHSDLVDMGVVTAAKHPSLVQRRQSDPGKINPALIQARLKYAGSASLSLEEDLRGSSARSRSHSPRRLIGSLPEDEACSGSVVQVEGKVSPRSGSPRRKLTQHRHSTCVNYSPLMGDESPRMRARKTRSHSLPMSVTLSLENSALEVGEALGALAQPKEKRTLPTKNLLSSRSAVPSTKRPAISRGVTLEEGPLESIREESGSKLQFLRQYSAPHQSSPPATSNVRIKPLTE